LFPYLQEIINEFPYELDKITLTPAALHLLEVSEDANLLEENQKKIPSYCGKDPMGIYLGTAGSSDGIIIIDMSGEGTR
jgi:hypothetical protein